MIVVDASAVLDALLGTAPRLRARLLRHGETLHAPHLLDLEVIQVLRRFRRAGVLDDGRAAEALDDFQAFPIERYGHEILLPRIWELRENLTAYDAAYVALAELLRTTLVTSDTRLARIPGLRATIETAK